MRTFSLLVLLTGIVFISCSNENSNTTVRSGSEKEVQVNEDDPEENVIQNNASSFSIETYEQSANEWGYRILQDGKLFIDQPHIPAIQGVRGFDTREKAYKTAEYVIIKINQGFMPPTVSQKELDSLEVL